MAHLALYFIALLGLSQSANLVKFAAAPLEILGFWRLFACALLFLPFALRKTDFLIPLQNRKTLIWTLASGFFFYIHLWTFFYAAQKTSIANTMILFSLNPLFTAIGAYWLFKEKVTKRLIWAYAFAFAGLIALVYPKLQIQNESIAGDLMALLSGALVSGYILAGKKVRSTITNATYSFYLYAIVAICFAINAAALSTPFTGYPEKTWLAILGLIIIPTFLGHSLFMYLVKFMNINLMTCGKLIEPALSSFVAYLLFQEALYSHTYLAFAATGCATLILFYPEIQKALSKK